MTEHEHGNTSRFIIRNLQTIAASSHKLKYTQSETKSGTMSGEELTSSEIDPLVLSGHPSGS